MIGAFGTASHATATRVRRAVFGACVLAVTALFVGCGSGDTPSGERVRPGTETTSAPLDLRIALSSAPPATDPFSGPQPFQLDLRPLLFPYLIRLTSGGYDPPQIERDLATNWEWDEDARRLTVELDTSRTWSHGRTIDAQDVVDTFRLYMERGWIPHRRTTGFRGGWQSAASTVPRRPTEFQAGKHLLYRVDVLDPTRVRLWFQNDVPLWAAVEMLAVPVVSQEQIERVTGKFKPTPGSPPPPIPSAGSFRFRAPITSADEARLLPNMATEGEKRPKLEGVILQDCPGPEARILRVRRQVADVTLDVPVFRLPTALGDDDELVLHDAGVASVEMLSWNVQRYGQSQDLRAAVSLALDRNRMLSLLNYRGTIYGGVARAFLDPTDTSFELPVYDPNAAAELLHTTLDAPAELGAPYSFELIYDRNNGFRESLATYIEEDLNRVGISVNLVPLDGPELFRRFGAGEFEVALLGFRPPITPDPSTLWASWGSWNGGRYYNTSVDSLFREQYATEDPAEVARLARALETQVLADQPFNYLIYRRRLDLLSPRVRDFSGSPFQPLGALERTWVQTSPGSSR